MRCKFGTCTTITEFLANFLNRLLQNDIFFCCSLAVEPLYPQVCQQVPVCEAMSEANAPSPVELSRRLNSLPCALSFHRDELPSTLLHLVLESRHIGFYIRNVLQLWAASAASLSLIQLMAAFLFLPPILTTGQVLWLACVTVPLLSVSLIGAPTDPSVMNVATGKNYRHLDREVTLLHISILIKRRIIKFSFSISDSEFCGLVLQLQTTAISYHAGRDFLRRPDGCVHQGERGVRSDRPMCLDLPEPQRKRRARIVVRLGWTCHARLPLSDTALDCFSLRSVLGLVIIYWNDYILVLASSFSCYLTVFISMSFIHRQYHLWQRNPFSNRLWVAICVLVWVFTVQLAIFSDLFSDGQSYMLWCFPTELVDIFFRFQCVGSACRCFILPVPYSCLLTEQSSRTAICVSLFRGRRGWFFCGRCRCSASTSWSNTTRSSEWFFSWTVDLFISKINVFYNRVNVRLQKRARLEFGTKLGMNSPFWSRDIVDMPAINYFHAVILKATITRRGFYLTNWHPAT